MRKACCTCGAGWTSNAFAWDEYINPVRCPGLTGGCAWVPRGGGEVLSGAVMDIVARVAECLLGFSLLMLAIAGCLL